MIIKMYAPSRNSGFYDSRAESLKKIPNYDPEPRNVMSFNGYYDSYVPVYNPAMGFEYSQGYLNSVDYDNSEEFPALANPPGFGNEDYYPPPGFSKPMKTKSPNPNAVSFIPSYLASPPVKNEKEEQESKEYGIRGLLTLQQDLQDDKATLAKGIDLSVLESSAKNDHVSSSLGSVFGSLELMVDDVPEITIPASFYISKPILKAKMVKNYQIETLFYVFYNMPGELIQSVVADELYNRDWLYDPKKQLWFLNSNGEWKTFDINKFEIVITQPNSGPFLSKEDVSVKQREHV